MEKPLNNPQSRPGFPLAPIANEAKLEPLISIVTPWVSGQQPRIHPIPFQDSLVTPSSPISSYVCHPLWRRLLELMTRVSSSAAGPDLLFELNQKTQIPARDLTSMVFFPTPSSPRPGGYYCFYQAYLSSYFICIKSLPL